MNWKTCPIADLPAQIFARLTRATADSADPLRLPVIGTVAADGCALRTVVLRDVQPNECRLIAYTDIRSAKVHELQRSPATAWLFYHAGDAVQVRATGRMTLHHHNQLARRLWDAVPPANRLNYCTTHSPGTVISSPELALPPALRGSQPTIESTAPGWENFAVLMTVVKRLDWLCLCGEAQRRATFEWSGRSWKGHWITP